MKKKTKKIKLPKAFRTKWIEMLLSGRYKQTTSVLASDKGYCCLGVAGRALGIKKCDLIGGLPEELGGKLAVKYPEAIVNRNHSEYDDELYFSGTDFNSMLVNMNDGDGEDDKNRKSFKEIAKYIKSNTVGV